MAAQNFQEMLNSSVFQPKFYFLNRTLRLWQLTDRVWGVLSVTGTSILHSIFKVTDSKHMRISPSSPCHQTLAVTFSTQPLCG